jgi:hypothetical protein
MESSTLYEADLTEERMATPIQREENEHTLTLDPDVQDAVEDDDEDDDDDEDEDEDIED